MSSKPKVCMLVAHHPFLDARIFKKEAISLARNGFDVTMVVPRKQGYLFDIDGTPFTDRFLQKSFIHEQVKIVTYNGDFGKADVSHMMNNLTSGLEYMACDPLTEEALKQEADIYHAQEYLSLYSGVGVKRAMKARGKSVKLIYDSHEVVPDPYAPIPRQRKDALLQILCKMLKEVDYVITVSDAMKSWFVSLPHEVQVEVIYNSPPLAEDYTPKQFSTTGLRVGYEGNLTSKKGSIGKIFGITRECSKELEFSFTIIGGMRHKEANTIPSDLRKKIILAGWVDYHAIPQVMKDVDIGWIDYALPNLLNHAVALPNKFFSFLNNGLPVVVNQCSEMKRFIQTYECGLVIDKPHASVQDYKHAFLYLHKNKQLLETMSRNARIIMEQRYSWEHMEKRLLGIYTTLITIGT